MPYETDHPTHDTDPSTLRLDGTEYHSSLDDNRRTTQQVVVPRRSGIHAAMQRGPRLAVIIGAVIASVLFLVSLIGQNDAATSTEPSSLAPLPTLTAGAASQYTTSVVVAGTGASGLFLRAGAGRDAEILATLPEGTRLGVTGALVETNGRWLPVETADGQGGWVAADYTREE